MKKLNSVRGAVAALAALGVVIPQWTAVAAGPKTSANQVVRTVTAKSVLDIGLTQGGTFLGRVVDQTGAALEGAEVVIKQGQTEVTRTITDKQGTFVAKSLKGGVYTVASGATEGTYRVWAEKTAPPSAHDQVLIVKGQNSTRGQVGAVRGQPGGLLTYVIIGTAIGGAAGGGYYAGHAAGTSDSPPANPQPIDSPVSP